MAKFVSIWAGAAATVGLMVAALWAWRFAPELAVRSADDPYTARLGIRSLAVAIGAAAHLLLFTGVIGRIYPFRLPDKLLCGAFALVSMAALGTALAMGWTGR
jgi:hypothetical protein